MKFKQFSIFLVSILLISQSCTVEKRLHKRGYYVEWKSFRAIESKKVEKVQLEDFNLATQTTDEGKDEVFIEKQLDKNSDNFPWKEASIKPIKNQETVIFPKDKTNIHRLPKNITKITNFKKNTSPLIQKRSFKKNSKTQSNRLARIGFIMAMSSLFLYFMAIPALYINAAALKQIAKEPSRYRNKYAALIGYVLSFIITTIIFFILGLILGAFIFNSIIPLIYLGCLYLGIIVSSFVIMNV